MMPKTNTNDLNPDDFSDSDWMEFTGVIKPFRTDEEAFQWHNVHGENWPETRQQVDDFLKQQKS